MTVPPEICGETPDVCETRNDGPSHELRLRQHQPDRGKPVCCEIFSEDPQTNLRYARKLPNNEFSVQVVVNNTLDKVLAYTGAKVSVCGTIQAARWGILDKLVPSEVKIQQFSVVKPACE